MYSLHGMKMHKLNQICRKLNFFSQSTGYNFLKKGRVKHESNKQDIIPHYFLQYN